MSTAEPDANSSNTELPVTYCWHTRLIAQDCEQPWAHTFINDAQTWLTLFKCIHTVYKSNKPESARTNIISDLNHYESY